MNHDDVRLSLICAFGLGSTAQRMWDDFPSGWRLVLMVLLCVMFAGIIVDARLRTKAPA